MKGSCQSPHDCPLHISESPSAIFDLLERDDGDDEELLELCNSLEPTDVNNGNDLSTTADNESGDALWNGTLSPTLQPRISMELVPSDSAVYVEHQKPKSYHVQSGVKEGGMHMIFKIKDVCGTNNFLRFELQRDNPKFRHCKVDKVCDEHSVHGGKCIVPKCDNPEEEALFEYQDQALLKRIPNIYNVEENSHTVNVTLSYACNSSCVNSTNPDIIAKKTTREKARDISLVVKVISDGAELCSESYKLWIKAKIVDKHIQKANRRDDKGSIPQLRNKRKREEEANHASNDADVKRFCDKIRSGQLGFDAHLVILRALQSSPHYVLLTQEVNGQKTAENGNTTSVIFLEENVPVSNIITLPHLGEILQVPN